ncbi:unnamed protein product [Mytilus coruscus]|uniref:Uncharacterized protein n=1 Tax=Mytilus coruscus TaxID=42192 RepID=A0A6J8BX07_MYTCO|nr:unnamed protein product [Mytilus coruscus]
MTETDANKNQPVNPYITIDFDASSTASINSVDSLGRKTEIATNKQDYERSRSGHSRSINFRNGQGQHDHTPKNVHPDFLDSVEADPTYLSNFLNSEITEEEKSQKFNHSQKIPGWAWKIVIYVLGVTYSHLEKQSILSRIIQIITLILGLTFSATGITHEIFDIMSNLTNTSLLMGVVNIFLGFIWICLGLYSQKLAAKLFSNRNFVECVRIHSRTFLKISVAGLFIFLAVVIYGINSYVSFLNFGPNHCDKLKLTRYVCHVMYSSHLAFTLISMMWNVLVGCTLFSVCRTHTVVIRRFISVLDREAKVLELISRENAKKFLRMTSAKSMDFVSLTGQSDSGWFIWDDFGQSGSQYHLLDEPTVVSVDVPQDTSAQPRVSIQSEYSIDYEACRENKSTILTNEEILNAYWKISKRMRVTSRYLQRWLGSWIFFVLLWISDYVITWLSHSAKIFSILQCILPLFMLLLLASAFAEVNGEGQRMIRCICPTEERLKLLQFLTVQPLQMQVFNFALNYNAIVGVVLAFSIAFASRLILDEIK